MYHVQRMIRVLYHVAVHCMIDTCIRRQPDMLESSLYNDGLYECVWVSAVHLTYVGGLRLRTSDQI